MWVEENTMNHRQRVQAALAFERPDRLPCNESLWDGTIEVWRDQGMPPDVSAADYFDFDLCCMSIDASPRLEQKILQREGGYITYKDRFGYTVRKQDGLSASMEFSDHVTTDREAWERIKPRFTLSDDPNQPARLDEASYFAHFAPYPSWRQARRKYDRLYATERYMLLNVYGPWEAAWRHRGMENLLMDVAIDPDWVREMGETYIDLVLAVLERSLEHGIRPDGVFLVEDLGSTRSTLISPASWRKIFRPLWERMGAFLRAQDIDFWLHTCGAAQPLLDDLIECGVRVFNPLQASAGFDVVALRQQYADRMVFYGNIDVKKMLAGREELEAEIRHKVPVARQGGFIFHSDHSVPPQVSFQQYAWMLQTAREIFER